MFLYPLQILPLLKKTWPKAGFSGNKQPLPSDAAIEVLMEVAYHASFLTEESRRLGFRIIFLPRKQLQDDLEWRGARPKPYGTIMLGVPRLFSVGEILRLAPATDLTKMIICVEERAEEAGELVIWGLLDVGTSWWKFITGESGGGMPPPDGLTISSVEPGNLTISRQGWILFSLRQGEVVSPAGDAFHRGPLAEFLTPAMRQAQKEATKAVSRKKWSPDHKGDENYPQRFYIRQLERLLFHVRQRLHGGTILLVPDALSGTDSRLLDRVFIKYSTQYEDLWPLLIENLTAHDRYYKLHFPLWQATTPVAPKRYQEASIAASNMEEAEQRLGDSIQSVAALSGVDGAVVITDRLRLLGFGAEVIVSSPSLRAISIAHDAMANETSPRSIEFYGTRHRAAFRFCSSYEDAIALVVSQDGGVKAVKRVGPNVIMWPDINFGVLGL